MSEAYKKSSDCGNRPFPRTPFGKTFLLNLSSLASQPQRSSLHPLTTRILHHMTLATSSNMATRSVRTLYTTARRTALRPRDNTPSSSSASQPVFKRDAPPAPAPPARPTSTPAPSAPSTPTPAASAGSKRSGGKPGSVYASYRALPYNTKLVFWTCGASKFPTLPSHIRGLLTDRGDDSVCGARTACRGQAGRALPRA